jgi:hypothetical protein
LVRIANRVEDSVLCVLLNLDIYRGPAALYQKQHHTNSMPVLRSSARNNCPRRSARIKHLELKLGKPPTGKKGHRRSAASSKYTKKYRYSLLSEEAGEIRLLTLLPGAFSEEVEIELHIYQLKPDPPLPSYQALSYAWGNMEKSHRVCVRDSSGSKYLSLTRNLAEALPYLRHETVALLFWIDAICVNQEDLDERSFQVKKMAEIYSQASNVVVWLGRAGDGSDYAMDLATRIGSKVDRERVSLDFTSKPGLDFEEEDLWWFRNTGDKPEDFPSKNMMISLENLFDRPWFKRLWVWQEIILARRATVVCGSRNLAWRDFRIFLLAFAGYQTCEISQRACDNLIHIAQLCYYGYPRRPPAVAELMYLMRACKCSDDRDRLYGAFNLLYQDDANLVKIEPNYSKPVSEIYREFARANYEKAGDLDIMNLCKTLSKRVKTEGAWPSWVPDVCIICRLFVKFPIGLNARTCSVLYNAAFQCFDSKVRSIVIISHRKTIRHCRN